MRGEKKEMTDLSQGVRAIYSLEELSAKNTVLHRLHPLVKLLFTGVYILCVVSFPGTQVFGLLPFVLFPAAFMLLGEIPPGLLLARVALALPFCLFAGVSNLFFNRQPAFTVGNLTVTMGALSLVSIVLRTLLCVSAVLLLVGLTPFYRLCGQLRRLHVPVLVVSLFEMTYRYIAQLLEQAGTMSAAYKLRSGKSALEMRHMGSFAGQLLVRSFDRAERIFAAMCCRGYSLQKMPGYRQALGTADWVFLLVSCGLCAALRIWNLPLLLGSLIGA